MLVDHAREVAALSDEQRRTLFTRIDATGIEWRADSWLQWLAGVLVIGGLLLAVATVGACAGDKRLPPGAWRGHAIVVAVALAASFVAFAFILFYRKRFRCDFRSERILLVRSLFGYSVATEQASLHDLVEVAVTAAANRAAPANLDELRRQERPGQPADTLIDLHFGPYASALMACYRYTVVALRRDGGIVPISEAIAGDLPAANGRAAILARIFGCPTRPGYLNGRACPNLERAQDPGIGFTPVGLTRTYDDPQSCAVAVAVIAAFTSLLVWWFSRF